jgi:hypothetical protein
MEKTIGELIKPQSKLYITLEKLTRKWWFYALIFLTSFIPPWSNHKISSFSDVVKLVKYVSDFLIAKKLIYVPFMPYFHVAMLLLFGALFIWRNRFGKVFSVIVGLHFLVILYMQTGAITDKYGLVFYPNAFIMFIFIALGWFWEAKIREIDYTFKPLPPQHWLVVAAAIFSFWNPDKAGDYRLILFLTSTSPIAYCMISTIYLALLCALFPRVNLPLFRVTSFISILIGIVTLGMGFFMDPPERGRYWSLLHTPMLAVSVYCFVLSVRKQDPQTLLAQAETSPLSHP